MEINDERNIDACKNLTQPALIIKKSKNSTPKQTESSEQPLGQPKGLVTSHIICKKTSRFFKNNR